MKLSVTKQARSRSEPEVIGFKLDDAHRAQLSKRAEQLGVSLHTLARDYVLSALDEPSELGAAVVTLNQQMFALREELALAAEALLTHGGKLDAKAAQKWVDENIKPAE